MSDMSGRLCQICNSSPAMYVCQSCGKQVCETHFDTHRWKCSDCLSKIQVPAVGSSGRLFTTFSLGFSLFLVAFLMILVGSALLILGSLGGGANIGFVILLGPIPVVGGSGPQLVPLVLIGAVLTILALVSLFLFRRRI
jgi:uncharacterized membrane protein/DNA-directed RNA polymerase subunit RPC12/RpoP